MVCSPAAQRYTIIAQAIKHYYIRSVKLQPVATIWQDLAVGISAVNFDVSERMCMQCTYFRTIHAGILAAL